VRWKVGSESVNGKEGRGGEGRMVVAMKIETIEMSTFS